MKEFNVVVGFSINPEFALEVEDTTGPKKVLKHIGLSLAGSSGNFLGAGENLGIPSCSLLGLVAVNFDNDETLESFLLRKAIKERGVSFSPIRVLSDTNIAAIPIINGINGEVWGKKGNIVHSAVPQALQYINGLDIGIGLNTYSVATGVRPVEILFVEPLLARTEKGYRVLNPKYTLCSHREFKKILSLVDLLVLNQHEFEQTNMGFWELHNHGPRIVVVTHDKEGGMFSFKHRSSKRYKPISFPGGIYETGAGDWFLGALISELIRLKESVLTIEPDQFSKVIDFAARVAGKKITMAGGGNGPSRHQLR